MSRSGRCRLVPWIESLVLNYGGREEEEKGDRDGGSNGQLKAHVIGVGHMSQSQARGSDGPTGLLFLSDGVVQIPAVLTASAWEQLQEQEDRELFSSLLNATVFVQDYRLRFHMAPEQTKCRFFLSVEELGTTAAGPVKDNTTCCTTLPSVRMKIRQTWRSLLGQEDSQRSQCGLDMSELLGIWQHDCLQAVLNDIREKLMVHTSPQPSTSAPSSSLAQPATSWDLDRVRYQAETPFSVPVNYLCAPQQLEIDAGLETQTGMELPVEPARDAAVEPVRDAGVEQVRDAGVEPVCDAVVEPARDASVEPVPDAGVEPARDAGVEPVRDAGVEPARDAGVEPARDAGVEPVRNSGESSPVLMDDDVMLEDMIPRPLPNPWDNFPPPCVSSDSSPEPPSTPPGTRSVPDSAAMVTSTQLPVYSFLPPYQKQLTSSLPATTTNKSSPESTASDRTHTARTQQNLTTLDQDHQDLENRAQVKYRKPKRKRCDVSPEKVEEEEFSHSPPSWLFETQSVFRPEEGSSPKRSNLRRVPCVHSDGKPFSYTYRVSGQNLQDFSQFRVAASVLRWAVKYLLSQNPSEPPPNVC